MLIAMAGLPGVGKSTLAERIAMELGATLVSVDPVEAALHRAEFERSFATGLAAYLVAEEVARANLRLGRDVVVDAANYVPVARDTWTALAAREHVPLAFCDVVCSDLARHKARIEARRRGLSGFPETTWSEVIERFADTAAWGAEPRLLVDTIAEPDVAGVIEGLRRIAS